MKISCREIHLTLCNYNELYKNHHKGFFTRKPNIITSLEKIRYDLNDYSENDIGENEMNYFLNSLMIFVETNTYNNFPENIVMHQLMTKYLMIYELDFFELEDRFKEIINLYFNHLNVSYKLTDSTNPLNIWYVHFTKYPENYIDHFFVRDFWNNYQFTLLNLSECGCIDISHDRLLSDVRMNVENKILNSCFDGVKLLSLGVGHGLQEFILIHKLLSKGITNIELCLVEWKYNGLLEITKESVNFWDYEYEESRTVPMKYYNSLQGQLYNIIRAISLLSKIYPASCLIISQYFNVKNIDKSKEFDLVYAIDFDNDDLSDFHYLAKHLSPNGKAIISRHYNISEYVKKGDCDKLFLVDEINYPSIKAENNTYKIKRTLRESML